MQQGISRRAFGLAASATAMTGFGIIRARADEVFRLRCSLDTAPSHLRNVGINDYLAKLEAATGGRIKTEVFQSGQLFADLNVSKALVQGQVEMAAPGIWTLTGFVTASSSYANGFGTWVPTANGQTRTYRITYSPALDNGGANKTVNATFYWQAQG